MPDDVQHSAGGIVLYRGNVLLIEARRTLRWQLPKGHLEHGETPQQAAVREIREETGAAVTVIEPAGEVEYRFRGPRGVWIFKHVDYYLCAFAHQASRSCDPREVERAEWHPWDRALELLAFANERELLRTTVTRLRQDDRSRETFRLLATTERPDAGGNRSPGDEVVCRAPATPPPAAPIRGETDGPEEIP